MVKEKIEAMPSEGEIEGVVGKINPNEPDVIQQLRRVMKAKGNAYNTEKAYVKKVRAFMAERNLKTLADFDTIPSRDVESHLTDLAVDGNVAASTQNQSFYALMFLISQPATVPCQLMKWFRGLARRMVRSVKGRLTACPEG